MRRISPASARSFASLRAVHGLTTECDSVRRAGLAAGRQPPTIALSNIKGVVHMAIEPGRSVIPRAGADKHAARKPLRSVVSVGRASVGRRLVISVWTNRCRPKADTHRYTRGTAAGQKKTKGDKTGGEKTNGDNFHKTSRNAQHWRARACARVSKGAVLVPNCRNTRGLRASGLWILQTLASPLFGAAIKSG